MAKPRERGAFCAFAPLPPVAAATASMLVTDREVIWPPDKPHAMVYTASQWGPIHHAMEKGTEK
jgi:hypothetical protein